MGPKSEIAKKSGRGFPRPPPRRDGGLPGGVFAGRAGNRACSSRDGVSVY